MVTPFDDSIVSRPRHEQVLLLKGCALCRITRQVDQGSTKSKPEWRECREELGVPIDIFTQDRAPAELAPTLASSPPPAVFAVAEGRVYLVLDRRAIERCSGDVNDFRGRLIYRLAELDLTLPFSSVAPPPSRRPAGI